MDRFLNTPANICLTSLRLWPLSSLVSISLKRYRLSADMSLGTLISASFIMPAPVTTIISAVPSSTGTNCTLRMRSVCCPLS